MLMSSVLLFYAACFGFGFHSPGGVDGQDQASASAVLELRYRFQEEQPVGTVVGDVVRDANLARIYGSSLPQLNFRFLKQQPGNEFAVDNTTGVIRSAGRVDREALCPTSDAAAPCDLRLDVAVQPLSFFRIIRVTVTIVDVNDNAPYFDAGGSSPRTVEVLESAAVGSTLMLPEAVDPDGPEFGVQSYSIIADPASDYFRLTSGQRRPDGSFDVRLLLTKPLDRELADSYRLRLVATDGGVPPKSGSIDIAIVVLDVNDNSPIFDQDSYEASLPENVPATTTFIRVHAVDYDDGLNGEVVYSLAAQSTTAYGRLFGVNNVTGDVYAKGNIDYEETPIYRLLITARDRGTGSDSVPVNVPLTINVVDLNDNAPSITVDTLSSVPGVAEIAEDSPTGSFVAHLSVVDADSGVNGRFTCSLDDRRFALTEMVGVDGEFQIATAAPLDHESRTHYEPVVTCRDYGTPSSLTSTARLTVAVTDVNDNDPVFTQATYSGELIENNYVGAVLLQVNATDRDSGLNGHITYSVDGEAGAWFDVDPKSGLVKAGVSFDRELTDVVRFYVVARDGGTPSRSSSATVTVNIVDVNDERPSFSQPSYSFAVPENREPGMAVGSVAAYDPDGSIYGEVTYAILASAGGVGAGGSDAFEIDQKTGVLTTTRMMDRESVDVFHLTVVASDRGVPPLSSTAAVAVYVSDENDNQPVFQFPTSTNNTVHVSNHAPVGHVATRLLATDADAGKNGKVLYFVGDETRSEFFDVDADLGVVIVNRGLSDLDGRVFTLEVIARDQGTPHHSVAATLHLVVNRSLAYVADFDGLGGGQRGGARVWFAAHIGSQNLIVVVILAGVSGAIAFALIIAIIVIRRQDRDNKTTHKYNCRTEALKMLSSTNVSGPEVPRSGSDDGDAVAGATLLRSRQLPSTPSDESSRQVTCLNNVDERQQQLQPRCCNDLSLERSGRSWPSTIDNQILQNPQACSSLLTDASSTAVNGSLSRRQLTLPRSNLTKPNIVTDYHSPSSRVPAVLSGQNREAEVCRLLKALQLDGNNETDSDHSGDGSNTDSGRGPSSVEDQGDNAVRARLLAAGLIDSRNCDPLTTPDCRRALLEDTCMMVDSPNQVVPEGNSYTSNHSYSALNNLHGASAIHAPNHLSTFTSRSPTPPHPGPFYQSVAGGPTGNGRRDPTGSLTDVANGNTNGFVASTLPLSTDRKQMGVPPGAVPAAMRYATYASNACVDDATSGRFSGSPYGRIGSAGTAGRAGNLMSPSSPLSNRRPIAAHLPSSLRRPAGGVSSFPSNGCQGNGSNVRLLGNDDSATETTLSTAGDDMTQYSCADVSAALRDTTSSPCCRRDSDATSGSVNARQLCDDIDELFFKT